MGRRALFVVCACALVAAPGHAFSGTYWACRVRPFRANRVAGLHCEASSVPKPYVALTRELGKNGKFQTILQARGIVAKELPCIAFENLGAPLPEALREEWEYIVVTSPEAASVFAQGWAATGKPNLRIACVGAGTKQVLVGLGLEPVFVPSKATGKVLAAELPGPKASGRVLYPASAKAANHVQGGLTARGFEVVRLNTYDTVSATWTEEQVYTLCKCSAGSADLICYPFFAMRFLRRLYGPANDVRLPLYLILPLQTLLAENAAAVALASPSATEVWAKLMGTRHPAACIGETSADACRKAGFSRVFFPEMPGLDGWADAVEQALASAKSSPAAHS